MPFSFFLNPFGIDRDEGTRQRSFSHDAAQEIGQHEGIDEGIPLPAGSEMMRARDIPDHSEDSAEERERSNHSRCLQ